MGFRVKFWGTRGSIACPAETHLEYGGNTSSIQVEVGDQMLLLDAGTGIRMLGNDLLKTGRKSAHILLTHTHWDHICGFPFFAPAFMEGFEFKVMAGHLADNGGIRAVFAGQMADPVFPVPLEGMKADFEFIDFRAGESFELGDVRIVTASLNHPGGATGYRIEHKGKSFCYVTDTEHVPGKPDQNVLELIDSADVVVYDSTYTDEIFPTRVGWGHSTWQEGIRICEQAKVGTYVIFHHDPDHDDQKMREIESLAKSEHIKIQVAREGAEIHLI